MSANHRAFCFLCQREHWTIPEYEYDDENENELGEHNNNIVLVLALVLVLENRLQPVPEGIKWGTH